MNTANSLAGLHALGEGGWLHVTDLGRSRYRLDVYAQEEELAPPLKIATITSTAGRVRVLLVVVALCDRPLDVSEVVSLAAPPRQQRTASVIAPGAP